MILEVRCAEYEHLPSFSQCSLPLSPLPVAVNCMSFNHNSNLLLTGAVDGMIRLFGTCGNVCIREQNYQGRVGFLPFFFILTPPFFPLPFSSLPPSLPPSLPLSLLLSLPPSLPPSLPSLTLPQTCSKRSACVPGWLTMERSTTCSSAQTRRLSTAWAVTIHSASGASTSQDRR